jgi:hypothetical protein
VSGGEQALWTALPIALADDDPAVHIHARADDRCAAGNGCACSRHDSGDGISVGQDFAAFALTDFEVRFGKETTFEIVEKGIKFVVPACSDFMERVKNNNV